jgi:hypothetical protein
MFPRRGDPPPDQPGYVREPGDPYIFHMIWVACVHRYDNNKCGPCGTGGSGSPWCRLLDLPVDQPTCKGCKYDKKGEAGRTTETVESQPPG